jgi:hypothetical protein
MYRPVSHLRSRGQAPPWLRRVPIGTVPRFHGYYEVLRLPAALSASLRFLRLTVTTAAPVFAPVQPDAGHRAWSFGCGSSAPHVSGDGRVSQVPGEPFCAYALVFDPGRTDASGQCNASMQPPLRGRRRLLRFGGFRG